jgi:ring-1,2-phenylacetyl-CoA epoxidase subunit PaaA
MSNFSEILFLNIKRRKIMLPQSEHAALIERIKTGHKITSKDEMTPEYYEHLVNLMLQQADSELAGAIGYVPWITKAPTIKEKLVVSNIVKDEVRHAKVMYDLLEELGIDVNAHIAKHNFEFRVGDTSVDSLKASRVADDKRVNIFYYPIETWTDFVTFQTCMDRGAGHQLEDVKLSSYIPWADAIQGIFKEEMMHVHHGDMWVKQLAAEHKDDAQHALNLWYPRTMNIFGRPKTKKNQIYRDLGLKHRDNDEVRTAFKHEIEAIARETGLVVPLWKAEWEKVEEDGVIAG